jgi:hypothetical protein
MLQIGKAKCKQHRKVDGREFVALSRVFLPTADEQTLREREIWDLDLPFRADNKNQQTKKLFLFLQSPPPKEDLSNLA